MNMKKILFIFCSAILLASCEEPYMQLFETKSTNTKLENEYYVYENETIKITYLFWHDRGLMSFSVFNKLETPVYIDWSKSCFISNSSKMNYWFDKSYFASNAYFGEHYYKGPIAAPGYNVDEYIGVANSTEAQVYEKSTFIAPKSTYYRSQFHFWPYKFLKLDHSKYEDVVCNEDDKKKTRIYSAEFDRNNTPLVFRNYLAVSKSEKLDDVSFIDNEFYVTSAKAMYVGHALGKHIKQNEKGQHVFAQPYKKNTSFYVLQYDLFNIEGIFHDRK